MVSVLDNVLKKYQGSTTTANVKELTEPPKKHLGFKTSFRSSGNFPENSVHQMDVLFLPDDKSQSTRSEPFAYRYLLVVTDVATGKTDARPMKFKKASKKSKPKKAKKGKSLNAGDKEYNKSDGVLELVQDIYREKKYLKEPTTTIHVDSGSEFNEVKKFYKDKGLAVRTARTARHSQQAVVEALNKIIGNTINTIQLNNQIAGEGVDEDGEVREWLIYLDDILDALNKRKMRKVRKKVDNVLCNDKSGECETYMIGDKVRIALDFPTSFKGTRLYGTFRTGDIRWSLKHHKIENILLMNNRPIRYVVSGVNDATFSKFELKPYKEVGQKTVKAIKPKYEIERFEFYVQLYVGKSRKSQKAYYVKYKNFSDTSNMLQYEKDLRKELGDKKFLELAKGVKEKKKVSKKQLEEYQRDKRLDVD